MSFVTKEKLFSKEWFLAYTYLLAGSFILALGIVLFVNPYKLAPGGTYGIAIVLHHVVDLKISAMALCMDIPLLILGTLVLGPRFGVKTIVSTVAIAGFTYLLETYRGYEPLVVDDPLLSTIFGGVLYGVAIGLIFKSRATSGGSDIIAMITSKYTKMSLGKLVILVDSIIVLLTLVAFDDWKLPLYSWILIYIEGVVIDIILQEGNSFHKTLLIISDKYDEIRDKIINDVNRGGTFFAGSGMYKGKEKKMIYTVVTRRELAIIKSHVMKIDPDAFMNVIDSNETLGKGFKSLDEDPS
ncbi:MAG: YitT family protein [Hyphomicrobiales bacterium]